MNLCRAFFTANIEKYQHVWYNLIPILFMENHMREGTSGFWVEEIDNKISIGYEDYGVSQFGGGDFEKTYYLDRENSKKFVIALESEYNGSLKEMIEAAFGKNFNDPAFWDFCKKNSIEYSSSTWSG